ncbi:hypothetical protein [Candidatus Absconditicoccus praedator]|uniref:hypothetical protein n=1 Tax=Candidatus Absconditicoccus praedator TaxID=2735562 RepID=UPI001E4A42C1|nr:hypothetical protein [Candidatus Absconditicoccus praedator]UFX82645.1 hypothetical protein HLG78_00640 [Candidatus Absconditicoccus praedator]
MAAESSNAFKEFLEENKQGLNSLETSIVESNCNKMLDFLYNEDVNVFFKLLEKSKKYKNGLIIKKFLSKIDSESEYTDTQKEALSVAKSYIS